MSHTVKIYDTCIGCTQCVRACPTDVLEMVPWDGCKSGQIASSPRVEDCVGCKRCETACPTDFLSVKIPGVVNTNSQTGGQHRTIGQAVLMAADAAFNVSNCWYSHFLQKSKF